MSEKLPPQQKSAFFSFIKVRACLLAHCIQTLQQLEFLADDDQQSLATFKGDLASLTAPPFLLSSQSIVEFSAYWAEQPSLFVAPASEPDPEKRALLVLKWFLSTLKEQHNNKDEHGKKKRMKPLNPFLGELFLGKWVDKSGTTQLVAEQVRWVAIKHREGRLLMGLAIIRQSQLATYGTTSTESGSQDMSPPKPPSRRPST